MLPTQDTNHVAEGLALRTGKYLAKPNIQAALVAFLNRVQELEDVLWDVIHSQQLSRTFPAGTAQGELDGPPDQALLQVADLVGAPVGTWTMRQLALLVKVWILARKSQGTAPDIEGMLLAAFAGATLNYSEAYPASFEALAIGVAVGTPVGAIAEALQIARPPGVYALLAWGDWPVAETFYFAGPAGTGVAGSGFDDPGHDFPQGLLVGEQV